MKLYICDINNLLDLSGVELLEEDRRSRLYRYRRQEDRARCLAAGLMLRSVFGKEAAANIRSTETGKPVLPGGPCFNLSHSGDFVVLLEDSQDIGVDVEQIAPWLQPVAERVFTEKERMWLLTQPTDAAFYRLWTGKEAIMKALGLGFRLAPESFEILPDSAGPNLVCGYSWYLHWLEIQGHMLCTASERPEDVPVPIVLSKRELLNHDL